MWNDLEQRPLARLLASLALPDYQIQESVLVKVSNTVEYNKWSLLYKNDSSLDFRWRYMKILHLESSKKDHNKTFLWVGCFARAPPPCPDAWPWNFLFDPRFSGKRRRVLVRSHSFQFISIHQVIWNLMWTENLWPFLSSYECKRADLSTKGPSNHIHDRAAVKHSSNWSAKNK